jgi:hypothetical protein
MDPTLSWRLAPPQVVAVRRDVALPDLAGGRLAHLALACRELRIAPPAAPPPPALASLHVLLEVRSGRMHAADGLRGRGALEPKPCSAAARGFRRDALSPACAINPARCCHHQCRSRPHALKLAGAATPVPRAARAAALEAPRADAACAARQAAPEATAAWLAAAGAAVRGVHPGDAYVTRLLAEWKRGRPHALDLRTHGPQILRQLETVYDGGARPRRGAPGSPGRQVPAGVCMLLCLMRDLLAARARLPGSRAASTGSARGQSA